MELKSDMVAANSNNIVVLLIEPYGIEIGYAAWHDGGQFVLLIEPYGIEINPKGHIFDNAMFF